MSEKAEALLAMLQQRREETEALKELYTDLFETDELPADPQFGVWLRMYDFDVVVKGLEDTQKKFNAFSQAAQQFVAQGKTPPAGLLKTKLDIVKFASGCMKREKQRADGTSVEVASE
jgi:hypothetical protein